MSVTYLDQLSTESSPLSSDKLLGVRGTGVGSERLYNVPDVAAFGLKGTDGKFLPELMPDWSGDNFVMVKVTNDPVVNGTNLRSSYTSCVSRINPNGSPRSETNRVTLLIPPGTFNLGSGTTARFNLTADYVDIIALAPGSVVLLGSVTGYLVYLNTTYPLLFKGITVINNMINGISAAIKTTNVQHRIHNCHLISADNLVHSNSTEGTIDNISIFKDCKFSGMIKFSSQTDYTNKGLIFDGCIGNEPDYYTTPEIDRAWRNTFRIQGCSGYNVVFRNCSIVFNSVILEYAKFENCNIILESGAYLNSGVVMNSNIRGLSGSRLGNTSAGTNLYVIGCTTQLMEGSITTPQYHPTSVVAIPNT